MFAIRTCLAALGLCASALSVSAGSVPGDVISVDVLQGARTEHGTYRAALRFTLADGWKTYWRAPGDAGIPPQFTWTGSRNLKDAEIAWPAPHVFDQGGLRTIGYKGQLILPIEITPKRAGEPVELRGKVQMGVCREVCLAVELDYQGEVDGKAGRNPAIAAALASQPRTAAEAGVSSATCRIDPIPDGLRITAKVGLPRGKGEEVVAIEPGDPDLWASWADVERHAGTLVASADILDMQGRKSFALDRSKIRITVLDHESAVDIHGCTAD